MLKVKKIAQLTGHNASVFALSQGKSDRHFLSGSGDGWVVEWSLDKPDLGKLLAKVDGNIFSLKSLESGAQVLAGNMHGGLHWVNLNDESKTQNILQHQKGLFDLLELGEFIYSAGGAGLLTKWSKKSGRTVESLQLTYESLRSLIYSKRRNEIIVGSSDKNIYFLDAESLSIKNVLENAHDNSVFALCLSADERFLFSGGRDALLKVWDIEQDYAKVSEQPAHLYTINSIALSPNGDYIATGSRDKTIKIWDAKTFKLLKVLNTIRDACHVNSVNALLWLPEGTLVSASDDRSLILWKVS